MNESSIKEGNQKLEFLYFKTIKEKSGIVYYIQSSNIGKVKYTAHNLFPMDPIPESIKPGAVPAFRQMSRRERRHKNG